jgi:hypothetical protein
MTNGTYLALLLSGLVILPVCPAAHQWRAAGCGVPMRG